MSEGHIMALHAEGYFDTGYVSAGPGEFFFSDCEQYLPHCAAGKVPGRDRFGRKTEDPSEPKTPCAEEEEKKKDDDDDDDNKGGQSIQRRDERKHHPYNLGSVAAELSGNANAKAAAKAAKVIADAAAAAKKTLKLDAAKKLQEKENAVEDQEEDDGSTQKHQELEYDDMQVRRFPEALFVGDFLF